MLYLAIKWMCDFPWQTVTNNQMVFHGKSQSEMDDDLGYPSISRNLHMDYSCRNTAPNKI